MFFKKTRQYAIKNGIIWIFFRFILFIKKICIIFAIAFG